MSPWLFIPKICLANFEKNRLCPWETHIDRSLNSSQLLRWPMMSTGTHLQWRQQLLRPLEEAHGHCPPARATAGVDAAIEDHRISEVHRGPPGGQSKGLHGIQSSIQISPRQKSEYSFPKKDYHGLGIMINLWNWVSVNSFVFVWSNMCDHSKHVRTRTYVCICLIYVYINAHTHTT